MNFTDSNKYYVKIACCVHVTTSTILSLALTENELLAPMLSRPKLSLINPSGIGGRRPNTGETDMTCCTNYMKRVTGIVNNSG